MAATTVVYGYKITNPTALTAAINSSGNLSSGAYTYVVTYVTEFGETGAGTVSNSVNATAGQGMTLTAIPTYATGYVTGRNIYRTAAAGSTYYLLATLTNNTTTTYTDTTADASLPLVSPPAASTADSRQIINGYTSFSRPEIVSVTSGITATASGTQSTSVLLFSQVNVISTVANAADGVLLPLLNANLVGMGLAIKNNGGSACNVYPGSGQSVNALSANGAYSLAAATGIRLIAVSATNWQTL